MTHDQTVARPIPRVAPKALYYGFARHLPLLGSPVYVRVRLRCRVGDRRQLILGDNGIMGPRCSVLEVNHRTDRTDVPMRGQGDYQCNPRVIEDDLWIGANVPLRGDVGRAAVRGDWRKPGSSRQMQRAITDGRAGAPDARV
jgi:acetyltransferase-like isoleucine patch superfamily enzyme